MPIKNGNKEFCPKDWPKIRQQILDRAQNKCEICQSQNHAVGERVNGRFEPVSGNKTLNALGKGEVEFCLAREFTNEINHELGVKKLLLIVLTIAHIDHNPRNNSPENLKALCQQCHNRHDAKVRAAEIKSRRQKHQQALKL